MRRVLRLHLRMLLRVRICPLLLRVYSVLWRAPGVGGVPAVLLVLGERVLLQLLSVLVVRQQASGAMVIIYSPGETGKCDDSASACESLVRASSMLIKSELLPVLRCA
jgi:hypothetical protein